MGGMSDLFQRLLGESFRMLPLPVQALHSTPLPRRFEGRATVHAAQGLISRLLARILGFPTTSIETPIAVTIEPSGEGQRWTRFFPPRPMRSRLWPVHGRLHERFGPLTLGFVLRGDAAGIEWCAASMSLLGVPLPRALLRRIEARESMRDGRYHFFVSGSLPLVGRLVGYEGWLDVD